MIPQGSISDLKKNPAATVELMNRTGEVELINGRSKKVIAILTPPKGSNKIVLGSLVGKGSYSIDEDNWEMTEDELLGED
jgi:hypothetical protein